MSVGNFVADYCEEVGKKSTQIQAADLEQIVRLISKVEKSGAKLIFVGNGGSAAIAAHAAIDFTKAAKIPSITFNESSLLTCFSNDYGYENWVVEAFKSFAAPGDLVFLISSSGNSANIVNAANWCREQDIQFITLSGFDSGNRLSKLGLLNLWVDSHSYNVVEMVHHLWICGLVDYFAIHKTSVRGGNND